MTKAVAQKHDGAIELDTGADCGSRFTLKLPAFVEMDDDPGSM